MALYPGLLRIAEYPERPGGIAQTDHQVILAPHGEDEGAAWLGMSESACLGQVALGRRHLTKKIQDDPELHVSPHEESGVWVLLGAGQTLLRQVPCRLVLAPHQIEPYNSPQGPEESRGISDL